MTRVCSFDVFDTLLVRTCASPADLFLLVGQELQREDLWSLSIRDFATYRADAELKARRDSEAGETGMRQIYSRLAEFIGWSEADHVRAADVELAVESRSIRAFPGMVERVEAARRKADQVLFVSDMYLPVEFLQGLLQREGFFLPGDRLIVSHDWGLTKSTGRLFEAIWKTLPAGSQWRHLGDHPIADGENPRRHGISSEVVPDARLNRYETCVRTEGRQVTTASSLLAGAMRFARLRGPRDAKREELIWRSGCDVAGPLLFGFVWWCLEEARRRGLQRLYFISRDGQILQKIALRIVDHWNFSVDCRYLYGSRQAWHQPAIEEFLAEHLEWAVPLVGPTSLRQTFGKLDLSPEPLSGIIEAGGLPPGTWNEELDCEQRLKLRSVLMTDAARSAIASRASENRQSTLGYLREAGLMDGAPFGIVDIGWYGRLQRSLASILTLGGNPELAALTGFYFGLVPEWKPVPGQTMLGYWNSGGARPQSLLGQNLAIFELFTAADHGSVLGYRDIGGRIEPLMREPANRRVLDWGLATFQAAVLSFVDTWLDWAEPSIISLAEFHRRTCANYELFHRKPVAKEVEVWTSLHYSDQQIEESVQELAPDWTWMQTTLAVIDRRRRPLHWWPEGSLARRKCVPLALLLALRNLRHRRSSTNPFPNGQGWR